MRSRVSRFEPRPYPLRVEPVPGETMFSYFCRFCSFHGISWSTLQGMSPNVPGSAGIDVEARRGVLSPEYAQWFTSLARLTILELEAMSMSQLNGKVADLKDYLDGPSRDAIVANREWVYLYESHYCPACIKESNAWMLQWRSPFQFMCLKHNCLLSEICPGCNQRPLLGRSGRPSKPKYLQFVPSNTHCSNSGTGVRRRGVKGEPCGFNLTETVTLALPANGRLAKTQRTLEVAMGAAPLRSGTPTIPTLSFFTDLRLLTALLLFAGTVELLGDIPLPLRERAASEFAARDLLRESERATVVTRRGSAVRPFGFTPSSAELMASVLPTAVEALQEAYGSGIRSALSEIVSSAKKYRRHYGRVMGMKFATPVLKTHLGVRGPNSLALGLAAVGKKAPVRLHADYVPQLVPHELYARHFQPFGFSGRAESGRRSVGLCLIKYAKPESTWAEAMDGLDYPKPGSYAVHTAIAASLNKNGQVSHFLDAIVLAAGELSAPKCLNYARLRRDYASLVDIPKGLWKDLRRARPQGRAESRTYFAVLFWAALTDGYYRFAPAYEHLDSSRPSEQYLDFRKNLPKESLDVLREAVRLARKDYWE